MLSLSRSNDRTLLNYEKQEEYFETNIKDSSGEFKLFKIRKLREGLVASKRIDEFAISVYELSVDECIAQSNFSELIRSISGLLQLYKEHHRPSERMTEMKLYLIIYLYCFNNIPNVYEITKQIQKYDIPVDEVAVKFIRALNLNDFTLAADFYFKMTEKERIIARTCFPRIRPLIMAILTKSCFTIPLKTLEKCLFLNISDNNELLDLLPFGIGKDEICELKRKKGKK